MGIGGGLKGNLPSQEEAAVVAIDCKKSGSSDIAKKKKRKWGEKNMKKGKSKNGEKKLKTGKKSICRNVLLRWKQLVVDISVKKLREKSEKKFCVACEANLVNVIVVTRVTCHDKQRCICFYYYGVPSLFP